MATPTLPANVITIILSLLPAKSVLICKSVYKLWYDLINSLEFVKLHLEGSIATQSNLHFVIRTPSLHLADFDTFDNPVELDCPFKNPDNSGAHVAGSCRGKEMFFMLSLYRVAKLDMETMEVTDVKVLDFRGCMDAWVYVENLPIFKHDTYDDPLSKQEQGKAKKSKKKMRRRKRRKNRRYRKLLVSC
ncbi:hypothetical protein Cgig2_007986 [Carnegiea gigantea]|uniref:F-box domain-containing protein n=1 Tax=Carnegiea gigantea TaxID=171969 RepID=A0A9Q1GXU9_9CARY|nr:hypothetical protein Cgig2_007986 [Carnegiea gigantea]